MSLAAVLSFVVALLIHELGHLAAARACGVPAGELGVGWGPRVWGFRAGGVEYELRALPVGAYVRLDMAALQERPLSQQSLVLLAGVVVNLCAAALAPQSIFGAMNYLIAATNLLPFYQQDGWKCGMVLLRALVRRRSPLVEWTFTLAGGGASAAVVAAEVIRHWSRA
jgi:membrane-associated protease RseP (regulator of RpoE activity)